MDIISSNSPKARKQHICSWCGGFIEKGEMYHRSTVVNDGDMYEWKEHDNCRDLVRELDMYNEYTSDGLSSCEFDEHIDNFLQDNNINLKNTTSFERTLMARNIFILKGGSNV